MRMKELPFEKGNLNHAYLIEGDVETNFELLQDFLKTRFGIVSVFHHVDVKVIDSYSVEVQEIRELIQGVSIKPHAGAKIYVFLEADELSVGIQNTLLKTLEDPPDQVYFFLLCKNRLSLLETVISRCSLVAGVWENKIDERLKQDFFNFLQKIRERDALGMRRVLNEYSKEREELASCLDSFSVLFVRILKERYQMGCFEEGTSFLRETNGYSLIEIVDILDKAKGYIESNVSVNASIDYTVLNILEVLD
ncbi:MAG: hypothetical protein Q3993_08890 [Filifactor alocis]|nr:hypothetical protein [Filifactor alocis]